MTIKALAAGGANRSGRARAVHLRKRANPCLAAVIFLLVLPRNSRFTGAPRPLKAAIPPTSVAVKVWVNSRWHPIKHVFILFLKTVHCSIGSATTFAETRRSRLTFADIASCPKVSKRPLRNRLACAPVSHAIRPAGRNRGRARPGAYSKAARRLRVSCASG